MVLDSLKIQNFQAHEKLSLEFSKHITTIVGPSDVGKSAVIRSLAWIATNRPRGESFVRKGSTEARAVLHLDGDQKIGRRRGKAVNEYRVNSDSMKAFGSDVPEQVQSLLAVDPELNFQTQHDAPFWINLSPPELARQLNRIIDLQVIDEVVNKLAQKSRKAKDQCQVLSTELEGVESQLEQTRDVPRLDALLVKVENLNEQKCAQADAVSDLEVLLERWKDTQRRAQDASAAAEKGREWVQAAKSARGLQETVEALEEVIGQIKGLEGASPPPKLDDSSYVKYKNAQGHLASFQIRLDKIKEELKNSAKHLSEVKRLQLEIKEEFGDVCSYCGQTIKG